jgi:hypothetical protein
VTVTVVQTLATVTVSPSTASLGVGGTQQYTATARDQFGAAMGASFAWAVSGGGTINSTGLFTSTTAGGPFAISATTGGMTGTASVTVTAATGGGPLVIRRRGSCGALGLEPAFLLALLWWMRMRLRRARRIYRTSRNRVTT